MDYVIQATGTAEFEDGLRTGVLPGGCLYPWSGRTYPIGSIPGVQVGPGLDLVVIRTPFQTKFQFCQVPHLGGMKLQL